jgi:small-conductance mechanosensitive channel
MEETIKLEIPKAEAEQFQSLIEEYLERMRQAHQDIARDEAEFQQLKAETEAIIARMGEGARRVLPETNL